MASRQFVWRLKNLAIFLLLILIGMLAVSAQTTLQRATEADEQCIMCHVEVYNDSLRQKVVHIPFFERRCSVCHQPEGSESLPLDTISTPLTGLLVDQQPLWRKQQIFSGEMNSLDHFATLNNLQPEDLYRFRLQIAEQQGQAFAASGWLGLRLVELTSAENREVIVTQGLKGVIGQSIAALKIQLVAADTVVISWQTEQPLYSWLELQLLEEAQSLAQTSVAEDQEDHPPLRAPDEQAINACYQCHPESTLGTSHPVRLSGSKDVRIPEELPTVDGMLTCVTCHDPHGSEGKMLVREVIKTKLCVACHYKYKNSSPSTMFQ